MNAPEDFLFRTPKALGGKRVMRLGLAANYGIDERGVRMAMDQGVNLFLWTRRAGGLRSPLKEALSARRDQVALVGFATIGLFGWTIRSAAEGLLKELGTDHLDVLLLGWLGVGSALTDGTIDALVRLKESGKVKAIGCSIHNRPRAGKLAADSPLDLLMIRYNAAHPGAERDIFPHRRVDTPTILAYTATSWQKLLKRPSGWDGPVMSAGDCYRFQLSNPHVDLALTGPKNAEQMQENLDALKRGALSPEEEKWMREFGHKVHG